MMWLGMKFDPTGQDGIPRELLIAAGVLASIIGALAALITIFYTPFPRPSPYGCYQASGTPLIRLSPDYVVVPSAIRPRRRVTFRRSNIGLSILVFNGQPYATFIDGTPASPRLDLPPDELMLVHDERRSIPTLDLSLNGDFISLPKVECPGRT